MSRNCFLQLFVLALVLTVPSAIVKAGDREFDAVVNHIKTQYHANKQGSLPFGLARLAVKLVKPAGLKSFRLAVLDNLSGVETNAGLDSVVRHSLTDDWQPLVRVYSRKEREQTYVYVRPNGDDLEFFVVAIDDGEATVVKAKVDVASAAEWMANSNWLDSDSK